MPQFRGIELPEGRQRLRGLMKVIRERKRAEAEARNRATPDERRSRKTRGLVPVGGGSRRERKRARTAR